MMTKSVVARNDEATLQCRKFDNKLVAQRQEPMVQNVQKTVTTR